VPASRFWRRHASFCMLTLQLLSFMLPSSRSKTVQGVSEDDRRVRGCLHTGRFERTPGGVLALHGVSPRALVFVATLLVAAAPTMARAQPVAIDGGLVFCASDSDCGNPYLACSPTSLSICRSDPDASATNAALADAALCPAMSQEVLDVCVVRYQLPCDASASCGPAGFTCAASGTLCNSAGCMQEMRCQSQYTLCSSDSDCPAGWSCYSPAGGGALPPDAGAQAAPKACYPPFAMFNGPAGGGGGLAGPGGPGAFTVGRLLRDTRRTPRMPDLELEPLPSSRRSLREVATLEARVLELLTACPWVTRSEVAMHLGVEGSAIRRPITNLLHAGRIRRQGHKIRTRGQRIRDRWTTADPATLRGLRHRPAGRPPLDVGRHSNPYASRRRNLKPGADEGSFTIVQDSASSVNEKVPDGEPSCGVLPRGPAAGEVDPVDVALARALRDAGRAGSILAGWRTKREARRA
jgi:hypothetical protein